jgi:hypothetical protein
MVAAGLMGGVDYRYELRRGDQVVATGHLSREQPLEVGERVTSETGMESCARSNRSLVNESSASLFSSYAKTTKPGS